MSSGDCHDGLHHKCVNGPGRTWDWCDCDCHTEQVTRN